MVTRVVYNNKAFKILNEYGFKFSNNEVTFNDITIDFTGMSITDIPFKYQEIKIMQAESEKDILNGTVLFTGYLDDIKLSEMKMKDEFREITLTLLSPLKLATKRNVSLIGTYDLRTAILRIIQPLLDDGFILKELNVPDGQITTNLVLETVENCMNDIGFKRNIFWHINELKEIFINSIDYLFGLPKAKIINQDKKENGLLRIQPDISSLDYANVINFKNIRLVYSEKNTTSDDPQARKYGYNIYPILRLNRNLKNGDIVNFDNPIVVDEELLRQVIKEKNEDNLYGEFYSVFLTILMNEVYQEYKIKIYYEDNVDNGFVTEGNISFSNDEGEEGEVVLQRDSFFTNLITGFKWNGDDATVVEIKSDTALRYTTMRFMYSAEINKLKGIISQSGQIEKTIDYNEKWTTLPQLIDYARSLMTQNTNLVNEVVLEYDIEPNLEIGDIVEIIAPKFFIEGNFAVKDISYTYYNEIKQNWKITLKSSDFISTYIDMFRPVEREENQSHIDTVILSEFVEEKVNEVHSLDIDGSTHTLNFNL